MDWESKWKRGAMELDTIIEKVKAHRAHLDKMEQSLDRIEALTQQLYGK